MRAADRFRLELNLETVARAYARLADSPEGFEEGKRALETLRKYGLALIRDDNRHAKRQAKQLERMAPLASLTRRDGDPF